MPGASPVRTVFSSSPGVMDITVHPVFPISGFCSVVLQTKPWAVIFELPLSLIPEVITNLVGNVPEL